MSDTHNERRGRPAGTNVPSKRPEGLTEAQYYHHRMEVEENLARGRRIRRGLVAFVVGVIVVAGVVLGRAFLIRRGILPSSDMQQVVKTTDDSSSSTPSDPRAASFALNPKEVPGTDQPSDKKVVYLTFEDGPSENTEKVLDVLDKYNAKATFFVTGTDPDHYDLIKKAYDRGHTIGLHSYAHDYATVYSSKDAFQRDLDKIGAVVKDQIGYVPCFMRFLGYSSNTISANYTYGIMSVVTKLVNEEGYQYYDYDLSGGDKDALSVSQIVSNATSYGYVGKENVCIALQDGSDNANTVEALPQIIEYWQGQGYTFEAISRSSYYIHHKVNN